MLLSAYVRYVFWCRPGFNLRTSEIFSTVDQALISYVRDVFRRRPGFDLRTPEIFSGVDQAFFCVRQRYFLE